jgi:dienelactone hydrolase
MKTSFVLGIVLGALVGCSGGGGETGGAGGEAGSTSSSGGGGAGGEAGSSSGGGGAGGSGGSTTSMGTTASPLYTEENVSFETADGVTIAGTFVKDIATSDAAPAVLLVHQFGGDRSQWMGYRYGLADEGYQVLTIDLRGHGESDPYSGSLNGLLTDPAGAPLDVDAALVFLASRQATDPPRIAIVGTSIGANLTVVSAIQQEATTFVAVSPRIPPVEALAGAPAQGMASVFYLASEDDAGGQAADCQTLFDATAEPRKVTIFPGADHGKDLLANQPEAWVEVRAWLKDNL